MMTKPMAISRSDVWYGPDAVVSAPVGSRT